MDERTEVFEQNPIDLAAGIVSAYVSNNTLPQAELPALITAVHTALIGLGKPAGAAGGQFEKPTPAQIKKSITPDALISFIDGKPYKALKRHLIRHGLDPRAYRERYDLPYDYPMVAASYAALRAELARASGLGRARRNRGTDSDTAPEATKDSRMVGEAAAAE